MVNSGKSIYIRHTHGDMYHKRQCLLHKSYKIFVRHLEIMNFLNFFSSIKKQKYQNEIFYIYCSSVCHTKEPWVTLTFIRTEVLIKLDAQTSVWPIPAHSGIWSICSEVTLFFFKVWRRSGALFIYYSLQYNQ